MPDELTYERAARRIARFMAAIGALGTAAASAIGGWRAGGGIPARSCYFRPELLLA